ncbi:LON peptidase substrate-binding domain-containing protein [Qipengyuania sp. 1NDW9]|uniref:LON peptidase substrate-binding domain-containing protein n=2 Tax=Qipengyuania TaxID=1855416 RepID=A0A9Q3S2S1_9SPHN|nr:MULTISPECIES: LON peptidase substrate-binding domain-containing protein [Qipengyuania]MBX7491922.1 LON peptidase substrate-binding domain-containing protein [Qipengyuania xiapuensis]MBY6218886.1 LON peptidase substrate-binding domain-containing protein [Qipengyuania aquimaris]QZD91375.1 LON peptidase substrate-binding domain-containing protein [Qipengyuania xiapuensis]
MTRRLSIFPLPGAILFPGLQLPLHIFEPRYRELVGSALAKDRLIGMIQPQRGGEGSPLYEIGCVGRIGDVEALEDGRYNIVLEGEARFRVLRELDVTTAFRQVEAELIEDPEDQILASVERAGFEFEAKRFAAMQGYSVDWDSVERLDDETLINGVAQIAPFDPAAKQALLEAATLSERCELMIQLMQFFALRDDGDEIVTLQ